MISAKEKDIGQSWRGPRLKQIKRTADEKRASALKQQEIIIFQ